MSTNVADRILKIQELQWGKFRQVLRNTKLYYKYLEASYHPYYINLEEGRDIVFNGLCGSRIVSKEHLQVVSAEKQQLSEEDIPYFIQDIKLKFIFLSWNSSRRFFEKTIEEVFKERIQMLSQKDMNVQEYFIRVSVYGKSEYNRKGYFNLEDKGMNSIFLIYLMCMNLKIKMEEMITLI